MTHVKFAHEKEQLFDKWVASKGIDGDFDISRQLLLVEEFKHHIHNDIKTHLNEVKVENLG